MIAALKTVFRHPWYGATALAGSVSVFALSVWLPNLSLIVSVMEHPQASLGQKIGLPIALLGSIATNFSALSASYTILIALLFGVTLAMVVYLVRERIAVLQGHGATLGIVGLMSGLLGVGCAACGSLVLAGVLALFGASGALALLPFAGGEFGILGVLLLLWSFHVLTRRINAPHTC